MATFMTQGWARECQAVFNAWPGEQRQASKLQDFWDWINMIRPFVTGRLALSVRDMPDGADGDTLALDFEGGAVTAASVLSRADAEPGAVFLLAGSYADWQQMLAGYDVGKMVMYRKLMLEKGDTLQFFTAAFYWTELLAAIQSVPVDDTAQVLSGRATWMTAWFPSVRHGWPVASSSATAAGLSPATTSLLSVRSTATGPGK
jgi:hypothetical protein